MLNALPEDKSIASNIGLINYITTVMELIYINIFIIACSSCNFG